MQYFDKDKFRLKFYKNFFLVSRPKYTTQILPLFGTEHWQHTAHILDRSWKCRGAWKWKVLRMGGRRHSKLFKLQEMLSLGPVQVFGEDLTQFLFSSKCLNALREYSLPRELLENHIFSLTKGSANEPWCQKLEVKPVTVANPIPMFVPQKGFFSLQGF